MRLPPRCSQEEPDYPYRNGDEEKAEQAEYGSSTLVAAVIEERLVVELILVAHGVFPMEDPDRNDADGPPCVRLVVTFGFLC